MSKEILIDTLKDILESIEVIEKRFSKINSADEFLESDDTLETYDSIVLRLQVIGELLKNAIKRDETIFQKYTAVKWNNIIRLRDKISHHYIDLDVEVIFNICDKNLKELKFTIEKILIELIEVNEG